MPSTGSMGKTPIPGRQSSAFRLFRRGRTPESEAAAGLCLHSPKALEQRCTVEKGTWRSPTGGYGCRW